MIKKYTTLALAALMLNICFAASTFAGTTDEKAQKVKTSIEKLGTGKDARVEVKLNDGKKIKGYVTQATDSSFSVMNEKTASATEVPYPAVKQVKGNNLNKGVKIAIGVGVVIVILAILGYAVRGA